jgi:hypothetical protein
MWNKSQTLSVEGKRVSWGQCEDPQYPGRYFVSIGELGDHTTFILHSADLASKDAIRDKGVDERAWRSDAETVLRYEVEASPSPYPSGKP